MPAKLSSKPTGGTSTFKIRRKGFYGLEEDSLIGSFSNFKAIRYKVCCCRIGEASSKAVEYPRKRRWCLCRRINNRQLIEASRFLHDKDISSDRHQRVRIVEESLSPRKQNNKTKKVAVCHCNAESPLKMIDAHRKRVCA
ncbi:hypothetical protein TKK_0014182 [Trichogramma kaykai]|uniref:Uncharacterized protein n=1 Tax=Trichogramma kaykai TaxID=54128 RepID=A0ABD2WG25_9HYME